MDYERDDNTDIHLWDTIFFSPIHFDSHTGQCYVYSLDIYHYWFGKNVKQSFRDDNVQWYLKKGVLCETTGKLCPSSRVAQRLCHGGLTKMVNTVL